MDIKLILKALWILAVPIVYLSSFAIVCCGVTFFCAWLDERSEKNK